MLKNLAILLTLAVIIALPFLFRQKQDVGTWTKDDPTLVVISPHNEAIRYEFGRAFSKWHAERYGRPVKIDWRNIGGTSEISRYLTGAYATSVQAWWKARGKTWPEGASDAVTANKPLTDPALLEIYNAYRAEDESPAKNPNAITSQIDLFFGGGQYDHNDAYLRGFVVAPWDEKSIPPAVKASFEMIPKTAGGEIWRTPFLFGNAISTFGIVYNVDRLKELKVSTPPKQWVDLADYRYVGQVGVTDPTKSGSIAKAFEMLVHQQMHDAAAGWLRTKGVKPDQIEATIAKNEAAIEAFQKAEKSPNKWDTPANLAEYQRVLEKGFENGLYVIQMIGGNARYFTDSATKVSLDVSVGDAAVGMSIDFYGRFQAQSTAAPDGKQRMKFVTPVGGTSVSCDPITLLRGAPHRELAERFIEFVLSEEGQRLWTYQPGTPGGPEKYALRRLPIRKDFYPSTQPAIEARSEAHQRYAADDLTDPTIDPYQLAANFTYYPRWTGSHFGILKDVVRAMCLDSGEELRDAWRRYHEPRAGTPGGTRGFGEMPTVALHVAATGEERRVRIDWRSLLSMKQFDTLEYMREWTAAFRNQYRAIAPD